MLQNNYYINICTEVEVIHQQAPVNLNNLIQA